MADTLVTVWRWLKMKLTSTRRQQSLSWTSVPDNQALIAALNKAPPEKQRQWIQAAVRWFVTEHIEFLKYAAIQDYSALVHVRVTEENRRDLLGYFQSVCNKARDGSYGGNALIQALQYTLEHVDEKLFEGDPSDLIKLAHDLLGKLDGSKNAFIENTYPTDRATLESLIHTLFLVQKMASGQLDRQEGSVYHNFREQLLNIASQANFYPVRYQAKFLLQTLELLAVGEQLEQTSQRQQVLKFCQAVLYSVKGGLHLYQEVSSLVLQTPFQMVFLSMNKNTFKNSYSAFMDSQTVVQEVFQKPENDEGWWYNSLLKVCGYCTGILYGDKKGSDRSIKNLKEYLSNLKTLFHLRDFTEAEKALRFGIALQLQTLTVRDLRPKVRIEFIKQIIVLAQPDSWGSDPDILGSFLRSLALVAAQSQSDRAPEVNMATTALKALAENPAAEQAWLAGDTLETKLQSLKKLAATKQNFQNDKERLCTHVEQTLTSELFRSREVEYFPQLMNCYLRHSMSKNFVNRPSITKKMAEILQRHEVCVIHGFGGVGKSTLAAHYAHELKEAKLVRWIPSESSAKLQQGYEQIAREFGQDHLALSKKLTADHRQYRQKLATIVYSALDRYSQGSLLILDNAEDAYLIADYLVGKPSAVKVLVTTRNADFPKCHDFQYNDNLVKVDPFSQDESYGYLESRFTQMKRPFSSNEISDLLKVVGPAGTALPHKLQIVANYLQTYSLVTISDYTCNLQKLKQPGAKPTGKLTLPEVELGLTNLGQKSQQLLQYAAFLDADFIPMSLVSTLLDEENPEKLSEVATDLARLSLMKVVDDGSNDVGLQVHREVQVCCQEFKLWSKNEKKLLKNLARVLFKRMPWIGSAPDKSWQDGRLYAPHVSKVVSRLISTDVVPFGVLSELLNRMGQFSKEVVRNYLEALDYQKQALDILRKHCPDGLVVARALSEIGTTLSQLGRREQALSYKQEALDIRKNFLSHPDDINGDLAHSLNSVGELFTHLGFHEDALKYKQDALAMRKLLSKNQDHPDVARSLNSVGVSLEDLGRIDEALLSKQEGLEMRERLAKNQDNTDTAHSLNNVGETLAKLGNYSKGQQKCGEALAMRKRLYDGHDHPYIAQSLNGLGMCFAGQGDYQKAANHYQQALEMAMRIFGEEHPQISKYHGNLVTTLANLAPGAKSQIKASLVPHCSKVLGRDHEITKQILAVD